MLDGGDRAFAFIMGIRSMGGATVTEVMGKWRGWRGEWEAGVQSRTGAGGQCSR